MLAIVNVLKRTWCVPNDGNDQFNIATFDECLLS